MIKITADSTCDLTPEIIDSFGISIAPLSIVAGDKEFKDGVDITPEGVFRYFEEEGKSCTTGAVNAFEYENLFCEFAAQYDAVMHINIGSGFSACHQNALLAAQNFENVHVVDSRSLSTGSGHIVYDAALMAKENIPAEEIVEKLKNMTSKVNASFVIDRLDYLHKGGRCSGVELLGSKLLSIKPCIEVVDGKMAVGKKYRGKFDNCLENYVKDRLENKTNIDYSRIFITHPACTPETVAKVRELIRQYASFDEIIETKAGCAVSNHCGPNTLGILFKHV